MENGSIRNLKICKCRIFKMIIQNWGPEDCGDAVSYILHSNSR